MHAGRATVGAGYLVFSPGTLPQRPHPNPSLQSTPRNTKSVNSLCTTIVTCVVPDECRWVKGMARVDAVAYLSQWCADSPQQKLRAERCEFPLAGCTTCTFGAATHISQGHPFYANTERIRNFSGVFQVLVQCTKISFHRGGGCVCFLKSVRKGRFRNVWVWGGGGRWSQF